MTAEKPVDYRTFFEVEVDRINRRLGCVRYPESDGEKAWESSPIKLNSLSAWHVMEAVSKALEEAEAFGRGIPESQPRAAMTIKNGILKFSLHAAKQSPTL